MDYSLVLERMGKVADAAEHAELMEWLAGEIKPSDFEQVMADAGGEAAANVSNSGEAAEVPAEQAVAMMCVAVCYLHGIGVEADKEAACDWMSTAGNAGCGAAAYWYGELLMQCEDDCIRVDSAMAWFDAAHRYGYADGEHRSLECELLSLFFELIGNDFELDDSDYEYVYEYDWRGNIICDENGEPIEVKVIPGEDEYFEGRALVEHAVYSKHKNDDYKKDLLKGFMLLLRSAAMPYVAGARETARCYENGWGTAVNKKLAFAIYRELVEQKYDRVSMFRMAEILREYFGTPRDFDVAQYYYERLWALGVKETAYGLAVIYETKEDKRHLAKDMLYTAAKKGRLEAVEKVLPLDRVNLDEAQRALAEAQASGDAEAIVLAEKNVVKLWGQVMRWLRKLSQNGDVACMYEVAQLYDGGCPYNASAKLALSWYKKAAAHGHAAAAERLQELLGNS